MPAAASADPPPLAAVDSLADPMIDSELARSLARGPSPSRDQVGELEARLAALGVALSPQGALPPTASATADAPTGAIDPADELTWSLAREGELAGRLASLEATKSELRGRLVASEAAAAELRGAYEAVKKEHDVCLFFERRRDFAAELPTGVLLKIMDHAPDRKCVAIPSSGPL